MANRISSRDEIDEKYKWNLFDIYSDDDAWECDFERVGEIKKRFFEFKDKISESADYLLECLRLRDETEEIISALLAYSRMRRDENNSDEKYQGMSDRAADLTAEVNAEASFIEPAITKLGDSGIARFINDRAELNAYRHYFDVLLHKSEHTLSDAEERILAMSEPVAESSAEIFGMFNNADIKFGEIEDESGEKIELTQGGYNRFLESQNRDVRKRAFEEIYSQYESFANTLATTLGANIKSNVFYAKTRGYPSSIEMFLAPDKIDVNVYINLIDTVNRAIPELQRYLDLRKRLLNLDELRMYDLYTPIVEDTIGKVPYEDASELILSACEPLGDEYVNTLKTAFNERWVDVYESPGKTSGAFSWGSLGAHPFILLNYHDSIDDVFTLIHEAGHAMHTHYTNKSQPTVYKGYKIFVAEVASTVNENLLIELLLKSTTDNKKRAFLLNYKLEAIRTVVFRQTMFAEFERDIHSIYEKGTPITAHMLCERSMALNKKYYAPAAVTDKQIAYEWARIPHFYSSFYVYQYATGYSAAAKLSKDILSRDAGAVDRYLRFLSSGDSDYPIELLKKAGVDLTSPEVVENTMKIFTDTLNELTEITLGSANSGTGGRPLRVPR